MRSSGDVYELYTQIGSCDFLMLVAQIPRTVQEQ